MAIVKSEEEEDSADSLVHVNLGGTDDDVAIAFDSEDHIYAVVAYDDYQKSNRCKTMWGNLCSGAHTLALKRGKKLLVNLATVEHPGFIKQMQWTHVAKNFVLGVPSEFCRLHLPVHYAEVNLEDESGESYRVNYLPGTDGRFGNGWRMFSIAHKLLESDVVVFHLVRPCYFKVYIIRAVDPVEVGHPNLTSFNVHANEGTKERKCEAADRKRCRLAPDLGTVQESVKRSSLLLNPNIWPGQDHPSAEVHSSGMEISALSERAADTIQESVKKSSMPSVEPGPDHPRMEEFHSSDMEVSPLSEHAAYSEVHKHLNNVEVQTWEEKEDSFDSWRVQSGIEQESSDSAFMVILKPPSPKSNIPSSRKQVSSLSRKKTYKQVVYANQQTMKRMKKKRKLDSEEHVLALKRAEELRTNLSSEHPSFIKQMQRSNVSTYRMLILPLEFCKFHLPEHDAEVTLEDESGESYEVKFHPRTKKKLDGGWKGFSAADKLVEGDVLVFHMLKPCYFKVYIVRVNDPTGSANHSASCIPPANEGMKRMTSQDADRKASRLAPQLVDVKKSVKSCSFPSNPSLEPVLDHSNKEEFHLSGLEACTLSGLDADFEKFKITVNGESVDPELSRSTRLKYYKLCCSQKSYLHKHLLKNVNRTLAAGIITGTLKVADDIRACKLSTSKDDFAMWDGTLEGFKALGMDIGFLRERLKELVSLESEFRETEKLKKYADAKTRRDFIRNEMKSIERKFLEMKRDVEKREVEVKDEMKTMKADIPRCKDTFQEKANALW